jgi:3-hydroxybutyryl-CoA dehydrogenase
MNEAARLIEEGVASAEDVDTAIKVGFGIRFATLGLLEFIDWGGGDILFHATNYLGQNLDPERFSVPGIVKENMAGQRNGLRDGAGFYDWKHTNIETYRKQKMTEIVRLLQHRKLMPRLGTD